MLSIKRNYAKYIVVPAIILVFLFASQFFRQKEIETFKVNEEAFRIVNSTEELQYYLPKTNYHVNSDYDVIQAYDLPTTFKNQSYNIPGTKRNIKIHEIWNNGPEIFLHYSMNMLPSDDDPEAMPNIYFKRIKFYHDNDQLELDVLRPNPKQYHHWMVSGVVYNRRIHRIVYISPELNEEAYKKLLEWSGDNIDPNLRMTPGFEAIKQVTFPDVQMISIKDDKLQDKTTIGTITLPVTFIAEDTALEHRQLDDTIPIDHTYKMELSGVQLSLRDNRLYFKLSPSTSLEGSTLMYQLNGMNSVSTIHVEEDGESSYISLPFSGWKGRDVNLQLQSIELLDENKTSFTITEQVLQAFKAQMEKSQDAVTYPVHREIGKINDVLITLLNLNEETANPQQHGFFSIELMMTLEKNHLRNFRFSRNTLDNEWKPKDYMLPSIDAVGESGKPYEIITGPIYTTVKNKYVQKINVSDKAIESEEDLRIILYNIPNILTFQENEIQFTMPILKTNH